MIGSSNAIPQVFVKVNRNSNTDIATGRWQGGYDSTKIIYLSRNDQNCQVYIIPPDSNQAVCVGNSWDTNHSAGSRTFTFILPKGWFYVYFSTGAYTNVVAFDTTTPKVVGNTVSVGQTYTNDGPYIHVFDVGVAPAGSSNAQQTKGWKAVWSGNQNLVEGSTLFTWSQLGIDSSEDLVAYMWVFVYTRPVQQNYTYTSIVRFLPGQNACSPYITDYSVGLQPYVMNIAWSIQTTGIKVLRMHAGHVVSEGSTDWYTDNNQTRVSQILRMPIIG